ncbi:MAG: GntR family transcriptional regulator [Trueperaceae bacterium]|nr:GntR family transcriptional regulator [Trueperaceae bacterium]
MFGATPPPVAPLRKAPTVAAEVHARLRHQLLLGAWPPGTRLREADLARAFEVSRTPVREAFGRLEQEGLLDAHPNQGVRVRQPSVREALDAYALRADLEGAAARLAAERADAAARRDLFARLDATEASADADHAAQVEADLAFHRHLAHAADSAPLLRALEGLEGHVTPIKVATRDQNAAAATRAQHRAIADAVGAGDAAAAETAMREHVAWFADLVAERLAAPEAGA